MDRVELMLYFIIAVWLQDLVLVTNTDMIICSKRKKNKKWFE